MPAIDFPASPSVNDEYSFEGRTWLWNGTGWEVKSYPAALQLGSAAAPSLYFTGDPNTGLYSPGADQVAITTGGTGRLFVDAGGQIGIGGTPSIYKLDAIGNGIRTRESDNSSSLVIGTFDAGGYAYIASDKIGTGSYQPLSFFTGNTERLRITSDGKVGIGTSSPNTSLEVNGIITALSGAFDAGGYKFTYTGSVDSRSWWVANDVAAYGDFSIRQSTTQTGSTYASRFYIAPDGKVGIGTSSPTEALTIASGATDRVGASVSGTVATLFLGNSNNATSCSSISYDRADGGLRFNNGATGSITERARIDGSGRLLVGTSSATTAARPFLGTSTPVTPISQIEGYQVYTDEASRCFMLRGNSALDIYPYFALVRSKGTTLGSNTTVANGDNIGALSFQGTDGTNSVEAASIVASVDGTPGANDMPGRLVFSTTADGAASPTERMRIDSSGRVGIGTTSPTAPLDLGTAVGTAGDPSKISLYQSGGASTYGFGISAAQLDYVTGGSHVFHYRTGGVSTERARIDSSGRLLVGTSTAQTGNNTTYARIQIVGNATSSTAGGILALGRSEAATSITAGELLGAIVFGDSGAGEYAFITSEADGTAGSGDYPGRLVFSTTADGAASPTEAMRINNQRELLIGTTTRTANGGVLQVSNGITFPATQSACSDANTLDDYEEGTWTPVVNGSTTPGTATYTTQAGYYTKIGRLVSVQAYLNWSAGTGVGNLYVANLPFTLPNTANFYFSVSFGLVDNVALSADNYITGYANQNSAFIVITQSPTGGGAYSAVPYDAAGHLMLSCSYYV